MNTCSFEELFKLIKVYLWLCGIPFNDPKIHLRFYFYSVNLIIILTEEAMFFIERYSPDNILQLTQLLPCVSTGVLTGLRILPIVIKRQKIFELTNKLNRLHPKILEKTRNRDKLQNRMFMMKVFLKYFLILNTVTATVYSAYSVVLMLYVYLKKKKIEFIFPCGLIMPYSTESWTTWSIAYTHIIAVGIMCILFLITVDSLYCVLVLNICNNFDVISEVIQSLDETNVEVLNSLVEDHQNILKLSDDLNNIFELPNLFNVLVGSLQICALGFNLVQGDWDQAPGCILLLLSTLLQILLMSVFGEYIIQESQKVGHAAYLSKWYNMDQKSKKIILIIMKRSSKPQQLTAYKFSIIGYNSFSKIISTSWSYFTILGTVYKPSENTKSE